MSEHKEANKVKKELKDSRNNGDNNQLILKKSSSLLISMISEQGPLRYGTEMRLGLIPKEKGARSYVLTIYFKVKNVESENWRTSTIMVHVTCLYLI